MESPPPAVFHDKAKRTQQGDLLLYLLLNSEIMIALLAIFAFSVDAKMGKSSSIVDPWVFKMLKRLKPLGCPTIKEREREASDLYSHWDLHRGSK